ncbi:MAG: sortase [Patescibacteria group bacterium]
MGIIIIISGISLVGLMPIYRWLNTKEPESKETLNESTFDHGPIQANPKLYEGRFASELVPIKVIIPAVGIDVAVKPAKVIKGKWEIFEDSASYGIGSASPGENGNIVVFAHAREGYFLPLRKITKGAKIYILTKEGWYNYEVSETKEVKPIDVSVIQPTIDETITLYTCSGFADTKRLIVTGKRV